MRLIRPAGCPRAATQDGAASDLPLAAVGPTGLTLAHGPPLAPGICPLFAMAFLCWSSDHWGAATGGGGHSGVEQAMTWRPKPSQPPTMGQERVLQDHRALELIPSKASHLKLNLTDWPRPQEAEQEAVRHCVHSGQGPLLQGTVPSPFPGQAPRKGQMRRRVARPGPQDLGSSST